MILVHGFKVKLSFPVGHGGGIALVEAKDTHPSDRSSTMLTQLDKHRRLSEIQYKSMSTLNSNSLENTLQVQTCDLHPDCDSN